jgi:phospholipase C
LREQGINCTDEHSEPDNLRCWIEGKLPEPGYTYAGNALNWPTIPDVLQDAGISWRIYQDPNDNWTGAMHGCLAFESFRHSKPGSRLYENGMRHWSLTKLAEHAKSHALPQVSWVLPPAVWSEHPGPSSPLQGAEFASQVLDALTANPETWSKTVFIVTFDENDGRFDHVPPPAVPSFNLDGTLAGRSTVDLKGMYFDDPQAKYRAPGDTITGNPRPWAMGPRVPMYVVSPWSKGGYVDSQVFDHSSVGQFLEKRFGVTIPAISPWHRAIAGDLTSAFDFVHPNDPTVPALPPTLDSAARAHAQEALPKPLPPATPQALLQEAGTRSSRPLAYALEVDCAVGSVGVTLTFLNAGALGAVFHVYDKLRLDAIPRRYTVETRRKLNDRWEIRDDRYHLWIIGPNGFLREFAGAVTDGLASQVTCDIASQAVQVTLRTTSAQKHVRLSSHTYMKTPSRDLLVRVPGHVVTLDASQTSGWYDIRLEGSDGFYRRLAGRIENGRPSTSDPAIAT